MSSRPHYAVVSVSQLILYTPVAAPTKQNTVVVFIRRQEIYVAIGGNKV